jgi:myo-inositol-1(or 4)-monophosphatase
MECVEWLPRLEAELRRIGDLQLEGARTLRSDQVQVKRNAAGETSLVTHHDTESERQLHAFLRREFPAHSFLGEETGNEPRDPQHYWILDPIDGTSNFAHGIPYWGPSLAYWRRGLPLLGLVYFPALGTLFKAWRGGGAWQDRARIRTSDAREYTSLTTVALHSRTHYTHHLQLRAKVRVLGSIIGNMCFTASGTFVAAHGRGRLWDLAAGLLILEEAGAVVETEPDVRRLDPATYARHGSPGELLTLVARANAHLPPLSRYLAPVR